MSGRLHIAVDPTMCEANGVCVEVLPEVLDLGDDDVLRVRLRTMPPDLLERAREAVRVCPKQALRLAGEE